MIQPMHKKAETDGKEVGADGASGMIGDYADLTPDSILESVEAATGRRLTGMTTALPSYINRVYALQAADGTHLVAKFYRPGRWSEPALREEHAFVLECAAAEIPVIAPMPLANGDTLGRTADGIAFALYPKRWGRQIEINEDAMWRRLGGVIGRLHVVGSRTDAPHRVVLHPAESSESDLALLLDPDAALIPGDQADTFGRVCDDILDQIIPLFDDVEAIRLHGDCHRANVLNRPDEGLMLIDFDDMAMGPPIQDLWMILPGHLSETRRELDLLIEGYEQFREFDDRTLCLVEPLRAMRLIYFLAWCGRQARDFTFRKHYPDWGTRAFWNREIAVLMEQHERIVANLP
jgi:Ser/Thr protein kinase RdoA (MazF antagonist)